MRAFLKGWRRKAGCVALMLACVMTSLWQRSLFVLEFVAVDVGHWTHTFVSDDGKILWWWGNFAWFDVPHFGRGIVRENGDYVLLTGLPGPKPYGFGLMLERATILPYWSLVLPLNFLSAYLILWKPRKRPD